MRPHNNRSSSPGPFQTTPKAPTSKNCPYRYKIHSRPFLTDNPAKPANPPSYDQPIQQKDTESTRHLQSATIATGSPSEYRFEKHPMVNKYRLPFRTSSKSREEVPNSHYHPSFYKSLSHSPERKMSTITYPMKATTDPVRAKQAFHPQ